MSHAWMEDKDIATTDEIRELFRETIEKAQEVVFTAQGKNIGLVQQKGVYLSGE